MAEAAMRFYTYLHCRPGGIPFYVGKGSGPTNKRACDVKTGRNKHHMHIVEKYGKDNIEIYVFDRRSESHAFETEVRWIKQLRNDGYLLANKTDGGEGAVGVIKSEETRRKLSIANLGKRHSDETKNRISIAKKNQSEETRRKISIANKGKRLSETHRANLAAALIGHKGCKHTQESKEKIASALRGRKIPSEVCAKLSIANKGRVVSKEQLDAMVERANNRKSSKFITLHGETKTLEQWIKKYNLKSSTVRQRFYVLKWSIEKSLGLELA